MPNIRWTMGACLLAAAMCHSGLDAPAALAGEAWIEAGGTVYNVPLTSMNELRFERVVRQRYDYSCGSAAIATLLTYHYGLATSEEAAFTAMFEVGEQARIRAEGFSMLDMKQYLDSRNLDSDGFRMTLAQIEENRVPGITLIETRGYTHFVVIKGVRDGKVLVGDPALGLRTYDAREFDHLWNGALLAIRAQVATGRRHFNERRDWSAQPRAPLGEALPRDALAAMLVHLPLRAEFDR